MRTVCEPFANYIFIYIYKQEENIFIFYEIDQTIYCNVICHTQNINKKFFLFEVDF